MATHSAKSGKWSNVGDWLYYSMLRLRGMRILIHFGAGTSDRNHFLNEIASALERFAALPLATRVLGLNAVDVQSTLRLKLAQKNCLLVEPCSPRVLVLAAGDAKSEPIMSTSLVVGISMSSALETTPYSYYCDYSPSAPVCPLPAPPPAPAAKPSAPTLNLLSDDEEEEGDGMDTFGLPKLAGADDASDQEPETISMADDDADEKNDTTSAFFTKCPICLEIPFPPWQTTTCGHLICPPCHAALPNRTRCPICSQTCATTLVPQLLFAEVAKANGVKLRCRYDGCRRRIPWDMARAHNDTCTHRHQSCPIRLFYSDRPACSWKGPLSTVGQHLIDAHKAFSTFAPELALTKEMLKDVVVWPRRQMAVSLHSLKNKGIPSSSHLRLKCTSLHMRSQTVHVDLDMGRLYKGTGLLRANSLGMTPALVTLDVPYDKTQAFNIRLTVQAREDQGGAGSKKRSRTEMEVEDEKGAAQTAAPGEETAAPESMDKAGAGADEGSIVFPLAKVARVDE